jgi:hypothetical protein
MFSVYRDQSATSSLRQTWLQADEPQRQILLRALHTLDQQLQRAPHKQGESRHDGTRIVFHAPLAVLFEIDEEKKLVRVLRAWAYRAAA